MFNHYISITRTQFILITFAAMFAGSISDVLLSKLTKVNVFIANHSKLVGILMTAWMLIAIPVVGIPMLYQTIATGSKGSAISVLSKQILNAHMFQNFFELSLLFFLTVILLFILFVAIFITYAFITKRSDDELLKLPRHIFIRSIALILIIFPVLLVLRAFTIQQANLILLVGTFVSFTFAFFPRATHHGKSIELTETQHKRKLLRRHKLR